MNKQPPEHLSEKSKALWDHIHAQFDLEPDATELLRVGLENLDLGDQERAALRKEGSLIGGKKSPRLDAIKLFDGLYLRCFRQLGLDIVAAGEARGRRV